MRDAPPPLPGVFDTPSRLSVAEMTAFLDRAFPEIEYGAAPGERIFRVERLGYGAAELTMAHHPKNLRPGGTVSGPAMFALADLAVYLAVLSAIGETPLAVTTDLTIHFLRKPAPTALLGRARLIKLGSRLAVADVMIEDSDPAGPVAHAVATYSIPPR